MAKQLDKSIDLDVGDACVDDECEDADEIEYCETLGCEDPDCTLPHKPIGQHCVLLFDQETGEQCLFEDEDEVCVGDHCEPAGCDLEIVTEACEEGDDCFEVCEDDECEDDIEVSNGKKAGAVVLNAEDLEVEKQGPPPSRTRLTGRERMAAKRAKRSKVEQLSDYEIDSDDSDNEFFGRFAGRRGGRGGRGGARRGPRGPEWFLERKAEREAYYAAQEGGDE